MMYEKAAATQRGSQEMTKVGRQLEVTVTIQHTLFHTPSFYFIITEV